MAKEKRTNRTTQEILIDDILKRANTSQLIVLFNAKEFEQSREKIQEKLAVMGNIEFEIFQTIHIMDGCVVSKKTGGKIKTITPPDIDFGSISGTGTRDRYHCSHHDVESWYLVTANGEEHPYRPR